MQTLKVDLLDGLTDEKIRSLLDAVDQDQNGGIDYSEFLAHSLTANQLSEKNIRLFFDVMRPVDLNKAYNKTLKDNYEAGGEENINEIRKRTRTDSLAIMSPADCVDARAIHKYFQKCGKIIKRSKLKKLMTSCGHQLGLKDFHGGAQVTFPVFYKFMRALLEPKDNE